MRPALGVGAAVCRGVLVRAGSTAEGAVRGAAGDSGTLVAVGASVSVGGTVGSDVCAALATCAGYGVFVACSLPSQAQSSDKMMIMADRHFFTFSSALGWKTDFPSPQITRSTSQAFKAS